MSDIEVQNLEDIQVDVESGETADGEREDTAGGVQEEVSTQHQSQVASNATATARQPQKGTQPESSQSHVAPALPRTRAFTSNVWEHATRFKGPNSYPMARCNYCGAPYKAHPKRNGTTSMKNHLESCAKNPLVIAAKERDSRQSKLALSKNKDGEGSIGTWVFSQETTRKSLARMIILDELPFKFVEGRGFRQLMFDAQPKFVIPSRWTVADDCYKLYNETKKKLKGSIKDVAMRDIFEDYRRALGSEKGCEASQTSQAQGSADLMDEDDCGDAMQLFVKHQRGSCEFDPEAESKDQTQMDKICLDLKNVCLEPNIDN
ncbi:putative Zinc finger, BED-type [Corchorus olitorius]|uniref:Zinc finger, BED-type n=1 Tax=Corchorus olitorius TaxID=93759 RepID=A0A1R3GV52_9ROSI|nr:putative Zinc finger, BED-type [Corchorus olitorius]